MQEERWVDIPESNYEVSDRGRVRNKTTNLVAIPSVGGTAPYALVSIRNHPGGKRKYDLVHRLVAQAFIPNPDNKPQVNHKDGVKLHNFADNLEWVTAGENLQHAYDAGLRRYKPLHYKGKFGFDHNRSLAVIGGGIEYGSMSEAARRLGVSASTISLAIKEGRPLRNGVRFELAKLPAKQS